MNALVQTCSGLIGSVEALQRLAEADKAVLLVLSDLHCDDYYMLKEIMLQFGSDSDGLVYCGDGTRDIVSFLAEAAGDGQLKESLPPVIALARGNGDYQEYSSSVLTVDVPERLTFKAAGRTVLATHGHLYGVDFDTDRLVTAAGAAGATVALYGHTHIPEKQLVNGVLVLNPGSPARPRGGCPPTFAVVSWPGIRDRFDVDYFSVKPKPFGGYDFNLVSI